MLIVHLHYHFIEIQHILLVWENNKNTEIIMASIIHNIYSDLINEFNVLTCQTNLDDEKRYATWILKLKNEISKNPSAIIPLYESVGKICQKYDQNQIAGHLARIALENMINNIPTIKYYFKHVLDFDDILVDNNFYDGGRSANFGTLQYMSETTNKNGREVIVIDALSNARYCGLANHLQQVKAHLMGVQNTKD